MADSRAGSWELDADHLLVYRASDGTVKTLEGSLISADAGSVSFGISTRDRDGRDHLRVMKFEGEWQADERNRLLFLVRDDREKGTLLFRNAWALDDWQKIVYEYSRRRGGKERQRFSLEGRWLVGDDQRIIYALGKGDFGPEFRCQLESLSLRPKKAAVKFRVGSSVASRRKGPVVTIFGYWRLGRDYSIDLDAGTNGSIGLDLSKALGRSGGRAFVRMLKSGGEKRIEAGITIPF
ncbi:MAG: hypothetical protein ACM3OC_07790 [Deltaproteobacteria bacterium]